MNAVRYLRAGLVLSGGLLLLSVTSCMHFLRTDPVASDKEVKVNLADLRDARLIEGMRGAENLYLDPGSSHVYVTTLEGVIYLADADSGAVLGSLKAGSYALGIDKGPDGFLYVGVCQGNGEADWKKTGGAVCRMDLALKGATPVTGNYPCLNGLAFDQQGSIFFASSNFDFMFPKGSVYCLAVTPDGPAGEAVRCDFPIGLANGMSYDRTGKRILLSDTLEAVWTLAGNDGGFRADPVYRKAALQEAFDDLCVDSRGRLWMADPARGNLKVYDPAADSLVRFTISGFGQASSCRIRVEEGREILYVTELVGPVKEKDAKYNGRGVLRVPILSLDGLVSL